MGYKKIYQDVKAEVEFTGTPWHSRRGRRVEAVYAEGIPGGALMQRFPGRWCFSV